MTTIWKTSIAIVLVGSLLACGGGDKPSQPPGASAGAQSPEAGTSVQSPKVEGLITAADLQLGEVDAAMAEKGKITYDVKCQACHSTGANRVVGPGWKGLVTKREPAWIMNMIMNIDVMLESDPEAQKLLEECLVRMPNQNLSKDEAREVLEFMRTL
ncbi:MAG: cytochrome c [Flavobacteriales bacterium]|nr:cytochrome c [Flavobacteriales bacterium]